MKYFPLSAVINRNLFSPWAENDDWISDFRSNDGLNVYEEDNQVSVEAAVPGLKPEQIKVTYEDGVLRIVGRSEEDKEEKNKKGRIVHKWSRTAAYEYTTYLPRPIDTKTVSASVKNGVITIKAKVAEEARPKEIQVKVE